MLETALAIDGFSAMHKIRGIVMALITVPTVGVEVYSA
jgi:hypothetical protein